MTDIPIEMKEPCPMWAAKRLKEKDKEIEQLRSALRWCSGSADFHEGGDAEEGWRTICEPLLDCESHHIAQASEMMGDEITPAMIEAGVAEYDQPHHADIWQEVEAIIRAALAARESGA